MCTEKQDGRLSGEVLEDGVYWQIPPFEWSGKGNKRVVLLERLDIIQVEAQFDADMEREL